MEQVYFDKMSKLGFDQLVCEIFPVWENVKDEILIPERKTGTGNGTIHVFLGMADAALRREFPTYYHAVENGENPAEKAITITHYFLYSNVLSMLGYLCWYNHSINLPIEMPVIEILSQLAAYSANDELMATTSLFKLSIGSSKPRPYFKQFDNNGVFSKIIRPILLPNSAYKVCLLKNRKNEYAAFWLLGFGNLSDFEVDSTASSLITHDVEKSSLPLQQIFYGAPGTGKSHKIDEKTNDNNSIRTTFHPDTDYATFVGAYKPMMDVVDEYALDATGKTHKIEYPNGKSSIIYKYEPQVFLKAYVEAWKRYLNKQEGENDSYYLVIEEINRGNCAQIFGDLFQLLDREDNGYSSYAISPESAITKYLAEEAQSADGTKFSDLVFSNVIKKREDETEKIIATADDLKAGKRLVLPPNLHIWATMNTSDQSLFPIDSAFKRRWDWEYVSIKRADKEPENKWIIKVTHGGKTYWCYWWEFLEAINHQIEETTHSEDKQLGYFFAKPKAGENFISTDTFVNKVIFYLWNDVFKDEDSAVFQYDNNKVDDVAINRSGTMYFRHFMENKDEMIHYFINQLFAMGKDKTPVVPIDYLKNDNDPNVIEHLPKMREDCEETPMPKK